MFGGQLPFYSVAPQTPLATMANLGFMENDSFSSFSSFLPSFSSSSSLPSSSYSWLKFARGLQWTAWGVCGGGGAPAPSPHAGSAPGWQRRAHRLPSKAVTIGLCIMPRACDPKVVVRGSSLTQMRFCTNAVHNGV
jgi:hypothetical protein